MSAAVGAGTFALCRLVHNEYLFFAGYVVLQYIVLATAWNILGGYCGYVNFGTAAFFALGAYCTVAIHKLLAIPLPLHMFIGGLVSGTVGLGTGYLTLRLRGAFFSIATLALAVVVQTLITNWDFVGGARGAYVIRPAQAPVLGSYIEYLFVLMLALAVLAVTTARAIERSRLGYGFATIRDDELAAEASGVPTLRLKLIATTLSGALMGMAGGPLPFYVGYLTTEQEVRGRRADQEWKEESGKANGDRLLPLEFEHLGIEFGAGEKRQHDRADSGEKFDPRLISSQHRGANDCADDQLRDRANDNFRQRGRNAEPD
jgi:branched-chain amino acid transport system permease protein